LFLPGDVLSRAVSSAAVLIGLWASTSRTNGEVPMRVTGAKSAIGSYGSFS
jgi:hypothetical protein